MGKREDRILNFIAEIIARFILGFGAVWGVFILWLDKHWDMHEPHRVWMRTLIGIGVGIFAAIFGTRKGPGAI